MSYTEIKNYIFSEIGKRVRENKDKLNLTHYQIAGYKNKADYDRNQKDFSQDSKEDKQQRYGKYDLSVIKSIAGGKAYPKKNPNLIPDSYLSHLTMTLEFQSELELLWGDFENSNLSEILFNKILISILNGDDEKLKQIYVNLLFDFVKYAESHSFWQMFIVCEIEMPKFPGTQVSIPPHFFGIKEDDIYNNYKSIEREAVEFLYYKNRAQIHNLLVEFILDEGKSFYKLDKKINNFVSRLTMFLLKNKPDENSLGLRARNIIISDYKKFGDLLAKEMEGESRTVDEYTLKLLVQSSLSYIINLKRVQTIELELIKGNIIG